MAEEVSYEGEVTSSNPADREFCAKNAATCDFDGDEQALASGPLPRLKKTGFFRIFFLFRALPSVSRVPDKWLSAKKALPIGFSPRALCRELRSAKALPKALEASPRAWDLGKVAGYGSMTIAK
jgi:hypothetical protein